MLALLSVLRHIRIHLFRPEINAAAQIFKLIESGPFEFFKCQHGAFPFVTIEINRRLRIQSAGRRIKTTQRHKLSAVYPANIPLKCFTYIYQYRVGVLVHCFLKFQGRKFICSFINFIRKFRSWKRNITKSFVINQLCYTGMFPSKNAFRVFADTDLFEIHFHCVIEQQSPNKRYPSLQNQFNNFCCLNQTNYAREHAQDTCYRSIRDECCRRRF